VAIIYAFFKVSIKDFGKPISRVLSWTIIHLGVPLPVHSSNLPVSPAGDK